MAFVVSRGKLLRQEHVGREVRAGKCYIDFANDLHRGIEIQSRKWHNDVIKDAQRFEYLRDRGWRILYIEAIDIFRNPYTVRERVTRFLTN